MGEILGLGCQGERSSFDRDLECTSLARKVFWHGQGALPPLQSSETSSLPGLGSERICWA